MAGKNRFVISRNKRGAFRWTFVAANGKIIAVPRTSFKSKDACLANISQVKKLAPKAPVIDTTPPPREKRLNREAAFEIYKDSRGEYRWRLYAPDGNLVARASEGYKGKGNCKHAIDLIKRAAPSAPIVDETLPEGASAGSAKKKTGMRLPLPAPPVALGVRAGPLRRGALCSLCCSLCLAGPPDQRVQCWLACASKIPGCAC